MFPSPFRSFFVSVVPFSHVSSRSRCFDVRAVPALPSSMPLVPVGRPQGSPSRELTLSCLPARNFQADRVVRLSPHRAGRDTCHDNAMGSSLHANTKPLPLVWDPGGLPLRLADRCVHTV